MAASILAGHSDEDESKPVADSDEVNAGRSQYLKIYDFLEEVQLDPLPDHYKLAWEYLNGGNHKLRKAIDTKLNSNGRLSGDLVCEIMDECEGQMSVQDMAALVAEGETLLNSGHKALSKSGKESEAYAETLKSRLDWMANLDPAEHHDMPIEAQFNALLKITKQMLSSTKKARDSLAESTEKLAAMRSKLDEANNMAQSDQLTGLPNRWAFEKQFTAATIRAKEKFEPLSVAFIDIDHFKKVNDTHGHEAGDRVLQLVAKHLDRYTNGQCHLARHGGEEFVIVLEGHTAREAKELMDQAREELAEKSLVNKDTGDSIGQVTFSGGVADYNPSESSRQLLRNADSALYKAKNGGRNRVVIFGQD
ncbi:MAG: GGDEF domain-containing protein [Blastomonas sp.]